VGLTRIRDSKLLLPYICTLKSNRETIVRLRLPTVDPHDGFVASATNVRGHSSLPAHVSSFLHPTPTNKPGSQGGHSTTPRAKTFAPDRQSASNSSVEAVCHLEGMGQGCLACCSSRRSWSDFLILQLYGPMVQFKAFSSPILILNSHRVSTEIFNERGKKYSGRPYFPFACGEVGYERSPTFMQPGDPRLAETHRMFHRTIAGRNLDKVCSELFGVGVKLSPSPNDSFEGILSRKCENLPCDCIVIPSTFNGTSERKICPRCIVIWMLIISRAGPQAQSFSSSVMATSSTRLSVNRILGSSELSHTQNKSQT
jgi:hypothetical protein